MRNVASKHVQSEEAADAAKTPADQSNRWGSLPDLNLVDNQGEARSNEEVEQNGDEGLQEVRERRNCFFFVLLRLWRFSRSRSRPQTRIAP